MTRDHRYIVSILTFIYSEVWAYTIIQRSRDCYSLSPRQLFVGLENTPLLSICEHRIRCIVTVFIAFMADNWLSLTFWFVLKKHPSFIRYHTSAPRSFDSTQALISL